MKIEIIKPFKLLEVGKQLNIDGEYASNLIKKGFAKSIEVTKDVKEVGITEVMEELRDDLKKKKKEESK